MGIGQGVPMVGNLEALHVSLTMADADVFRWNVFF